MRYDYQDIRHFTEPGTTGWVIGEIEGRYGPLGPSERKNILYAYERLSGRFFAYGDGHASLLVEGEPGTTLPIFGDFEEYHSPDPTGEIEPATWLNTGTELKDGPAFVRMDRNRHRIQDCLFFLRITDEPAFCEVIPASRGWWGRYCFGPMLWPEFWEYLFRYLLKEARETDHDSRFTWMIGDEEILTFFGRHPEFLEQGLLNGYLDELTDDCPESTLGKVTLTELEKNLGFKIPKPFAEKISTRLRQSSR